MGKFESVRKMWKVGDKIFPASNEAEALLVKKSLEKGGDAKKGSVLAEVGLESDYKYNKGLSDKLENKIKEEAKPGILDYLSRPQASAMNAISAMQMGKSGPDVLSAAKEGLTRPSEESKTGFDIASTVSDQTGIENPYVLTGIATAADTLLDPTNAIGGIGKLGKFKKIRDLIGK